MLTMPLEKMFRMLSSVVDSAILLKMKAAPKNAPYVTYHARVNLKL
jgi:hypothetical protein